MALIALVAAVELGGSFGSGSATTESLGSSSIVVDIRVELEVSAQSVVAHLSAPGTPDITLPLLDRGEGVYGVRTELERKDYTVVFEAIGAPAGLSDAVTLTELGATLSEPRGEADPDADEDELSDQTSTIGWLGLALGAASLSALAFWVLGARDSEESGTVAEEE